MSKKPAALLTVIFGLLVLTLFLINEPINSSPKEEISALYPNGSLFNVKIDHWGPELFERRVPIVDG